MLNYKDICNNYSRRMGNEVGWVSQISEIGIGAIQSNATPKGVEPIRSLNSQGIKAIYKMQIVYLVNLFESFMQDFIEAKDELTESQVSQRNFWSSYLKEVRNLWDNHCNQTSSIKNNSKSFMNLHYSLFVLENKYNIQFPTYLTPVISELGSLRNCLVHYDGELSYKDKGGRIFRDTLINTLDFLEISNTNNLITDLNKNGFINVVTFDLSCFVELCGGFIRKPLLHDEYLRKLEVN